jgi:Mycothiol maleylpyruvate isomerase N-terminal domain
VTVDRLARPRIVASYAEAVGALRDISQRIPQWEWPTPCDRWTVLDLSGHLLTIVRYWHRLLDAAEVGRPLVELPRGRELEAMNARDLASLTDAHEGKGPARMELFLALASAHLRRIERADWEITLGHWSGLGPLTVGQHSGVAIGEWHVHAWDMARSIGADHRPRDATVVAEGNRPVRDVAGEEDPWRALLTAYGRDPDWRNGPI